MLCKKNRLQRCALEKGFTAFIRYNIIIDTFDFTYSYIYIYIFIYCFLFMY